MTDSIDALQMNVLAVAVPHLEQALQESVSGVSIEFVGIDQAYQNQQVLRQSCDLLLFDLVHHAQDQLAQLRQAYPEHPILALVADSAFEDGEAALEAGADDYLVGQQIKPLLARRIAHYGHFAGSSAEYVLQKAGDGMLVVDDNGVIRMTNPSAARLIGYPEEDLIGRVFGYPVLAGENTEIDLVRPHGDPRVVEMRAVKIRWQGQKASLAILRDITDRIQTEQQLHLRDRAIHASSSAIFILDVSHPAWRLTFVNPAFTDITGYLAEDVVGRKYEFLLELHEKTPLPGELLESFEKNSEHITTTVSHHRNGDRYWSELRYAPIFDDIGRLSHIVVVQNDVTQSKVLEKERLQNEKIRVALQKERELNQIKDRFLETMAHELHTPLASIMLSHDMLRHYGDRSTEEDREEFLENIREQVERLNAIVNDVLDISRTQEKELNISPESINVVALCRRVFKSYRKKHKSTRKLTFNTEQQTIQAAVDPERLERALENLLENAVKYSKANGEIRFNIRLEEDNVLITISDDGIGVPEADRNRVFDPFHRGENVGNRPGTGLGLTVVRQVVRGHQGNVDIKSHVNGGTTIYIQLPTAITI